MSSHPDRARRLFLIAGLATMFAAPLGAQDTSTTGTTPATGTIMQDTVANTTDDGGFPWGLLGLLGLAGLLGRRKVETVHETTRPAPRPGDPNYRV